MDETVWTTVLRIEDPDLCYETNEFIVQEAGYGRYRYGSDGGCSCYDGFDESNFIVTHSRWDIRDAFGRWATELDNPARAWEAYMAAGL